MHRALQTGIADDAALMRRALEATALGIAHGSGPFGALVADPTDAALRRPAERLA